MKIRAMKFVTLSVLLLTLGACGSGQNSPMGSPSSSSNGQLPRSAVAQGLPPLITGFTPAWQTVGAALTISGSNFDPIAANNAVTFANAVPAVVAAATATELRVIVPAGAVSGGLSVATAGGSATSATSFIVQRAGGASAPTITALPASGSIGASVVINGSNFEATRPDANFVAFNGTPAQVTAATATTLTVTVPKATTGNVSIVTPAGTAISSHTFTILPLAGTVPYISSFSPLRAASGSVVTLNGVNFATLTPPVEVKFNGMPSSATVVNDTTLTASVPPGASSGPLTLSFAGGVAHSALNFIVSSGGASVAGLVGGAIQGTPLNLQGTALTFAGGGIYTSAMDGTGASARFNNPNGVTSDGLNLYLADSGNRVIRRIELATGVVTTLAGSGVSGSADGTGRGASFATPNGITTDGTSLFVTDSGNNRIRKITPLPGTGGLATMTSDNAAVSTLAGSGSILTADDAIGINAAIRSPYGITTDGINLYVADGSNRIRKVVIAAPSAVTTLAGSGKFLSAEGTGSAASFYRPHGITITPDHTTLFVTDSGTNVVRKVDIATAVVTNLFGPGFVEGAKVSKLQNPYGLATDGTTLYLVDAGSNRILKVAIASPSQVTVVAGSGQIGSTDGVGVLASFRLPNSIAVAGGQIYVTDSGNNLIRAIDLASSAVTTLAGNVVDQSPTEGLGTASTFNFPAAMTTDGTNLYIADSGRNLIRKIVIASGEVSSLAGSGYFGDLDARGAMATFNHPFGLTCDGTSLFVADSGNNKIRQIDLASGDVTTLAGSGSYGADNGLGAAATFSRPLGLTTDGTNLYVADTGSHTIRQVVIATGAVTTLAGSGVAGFTDATGAAAAFHAPSGITTDGTDLFIADSGSNKIRQLTIASRLVTTLAGTGDYWYNDPYDTTHLGGWWPGREAGFRHPVGITMDGSNLYVADSENNQIRQIKLATGEVRILSGSGAFGSNDGTGTEASFSQPFGITTDGNHLYTSEYLDNLIRKIQ